MVAQCKGCSVTPSSWAVSLNSLQKVTFLRILSFQKVCQTIIFLDTTFQEVHYKNDNARLSSRERSCTPLITLVALCWTQSHTSTSLLYWETQNWAQHSSCASAVLSREERSLEARALQNHSHICNRLR